MLYSVDSGKYIRKLPHQADFDKWRKKLSDEDYESIKKELEKRLTESEVNTAGWIPGHDWTGTVFEPIYYACNENQTQAGMFFGLIVFKVLMEYEGKAWGFGKYEKDGVPISSMTYFLFDKMPVE